MSQPGFKKQIQTKWYIYIYIYREREREREGEPVAVPLDPSVSVAHQEFCQKLIVKKIQKKYYDTSFEKGIINRK